MELVRRERKKVPNQVGNEIASGPPPLEPERQELQRVFRGVKLVRRKEPRHALGPLALLGGECAKSEGQYQIANGIGLLCQALAQAFVCNKVQKPQPNLFAIGCGIGWSESTHEL